MTFERAIMCGFETGTLAEASSTSGASLINNLSGDPQRHVYSGNYACRIQNVSNVTLDLTTAAAHVVVRAYANIKVVAIGSYIELFQLENTGGDIFEVRLDEDATGYYIELYDDTAASSISKTYITVHLGAWINISLVTGVFHADEISFYIGEDLIVRSTMTTALGSMRYLRVAGHSSTNAYIDDLCFGRLSPGQGRYQLFPFGPTGDFAGQVNMNPVSGNNNYAMVDEIPPDGDGTQNSTSSTAYDIYTCDRPSIPDNVEILSVHEVQVVLGAAEVSGTTTIEGMLRMAGTNYFSDSVNPTWPMGGTYNHYACRFFGNPVTSSGWTLDAVNGIDGIGARCNITSGSTRFTQIIAYACCKTKDIAFDQGPGGFDIEFDIPALTVDLHYIGLIMDVTHDFVQDDSMVLKLTRNLGNILEVDLAGYDSEVTYMKFTSLASATDPHHVRVLLQDQFLTVYIDDQWLISYWLINPVYPDAGVTLQLYSNSSYTVTNVRITELSDWREAVFVDMETKGGSALGYVIQQRPVEAYPMTDGGLDFVYDKTRSTVTLAAVHDWEVNETEPPQAGSDIVVYADNVYSIYSDDYASDIGFNLKVYRLPELTHGARDAAQVILDRALESAIRHTGSGRPDIRVEIGDKARVNETLSGTVTSFDETMIVETLSISVQDGEGTGTWSGREGA